MTENYLYKLVHSDIIANIWRSLLWMKVWSSFSVKLLRLAFPKWQALHGAHYPVFTRTFWLFARESASWLRTPVLLVTSLHFVWTRKPPTATGEAARVSKDQEGRIPAGFRMKTQPLIFWALNLMSQGQKPKAEAPSSKCRVLCTQVIRPHARLCPGDCPMTNFKRTHSVVLFTLEPNGFLCKHVAALNKNCHAASLSSFC